MTRPLVAFTHKPDVQLPREMIGRMNRIGAAFRQATGRALHVTSGTRNANGQANAMYNNLRKNQTASYDNKAAFNEIKQAYDNGVGAGHNSAQIKRDMTRVIQSQIDRGIFISCHLAGCAADIRTRDEPGYPAMTDRERRILQQIVEDQEHGGMIREGDHIHLQFL